jgi:hypothetical protein
MNRKGKSRELAVDHAANLGQKARLFGIGSRARLLT